MSTIRIGPPYLQQLEGVTRLCASIQWEGWPETLYFEVENEFSDGLCTERADAFVCALLVTAMEHGCDLESEAPTSEQLYYQLSTYIIPAFSRYHSRLQSIRLRSPLAPSLPKPSGVATGCSAGVDSFHTILTHQSQDCPSHKITHLMFNTIGTTVHNETNIRGWFNDRKVIMKEIANELNLQSIAMYTNIHQFYEYPYQSFMWYYTLLYAACALAMQNLIGIYYAASGGYALDTFDIHENARSNADFDIFTLPCLSNGTVTFYSSGCIDTRMEKLFKIADSPIVQKYLSVCMAEVHGDGKVLKGKPNCGICAKCQNTMAELYAINKLENFSQVFPIECFLFNPPRMLAKSTAATSPLRYEEIVNAVKAEGKPLGIRYYFWLNAVYRPYKRLKKALRNIRWVQRIYYSHQIDIKTNGFRKVGK